MSSIQVPVIDLDNHPIGEVILNGDIFGLPVRSDVLSRVVEWQRAKRRAGTHHTKGIGDISGTGKKLYKQKKTGRARHGSARAGLFRTGAVLLGPKFRSHAYSMQKKVRDLALKMALSLKYKESRLVILKDLNLETHKTKNLASKLVNLGMRSGLFVNDDQQTNFVRAYKNIRNIDALPVCGLNVYDIMNHDYLVLTAAGIAALEQRLLAQQDSAVNKVQAS